MTLPFHVLLQTRAAEYVAELVLTSDAAKNKVNILCHCVFNMMFLSNSYFKYLVARPLKRGMHA